MEEIIDLIVGIFLYWEYVLSVIFLVVGIFLITIGTTAGIISGISLILTIAFLVYRILKKKENSDPDNR